jgi:hypothetical protein
MIWTGSGFTPQIRRPTLQELRTDRREERFRSHFRKKNYCDCQIIDKDGKFPAVSEKPNPGIFIQVMEHTSFGLEYIVNILKPVLKESNLEIVNIADTPPLSLDINTKPGFPIIQNEETAILHPVKGKFTCGTLELEMLSEAKHNRIQVNTFLRWWYNTSIYARASYVEPWGKPILSMLAYNGAISLDLLSRAEESESSMPYILNFLFKRNNANEEKEKYLVCARFGPTHAIGKSLVS